MRVIRLFICALLAQLILTSPSSAEVGVGRFKGEVVARFLPDGRNMRLEQPFGYVDPAGQAWDVPSGTETDGASIPRVLWITNPPFTGKYRAAAVVHDYYCRTRSRAWKATHKVFYQAMRAAGVAERTAKIMYAAVYYFGPRWGADGRSLPRGTGAAQELPFEEQSRLLEALKAWIEAEGPDIEGIARQIDAGGVGGMSAKPGEDRVALIIGNSAYRHAPVLPNPQNDATDIAEAMQKLGFKVIKGIDLDKTGMERAIRQFARALDKGKVGVFFYAGHGLQVGGQNYLVPVDAKLEDESALDFELTRLALVQRAMEREAETNILFLDACRDNPLARNLARSMGTRSTEIGRGLAAVESGVGTLISFSTQPGNVALDGKGRNSPFAGALVQQMLTGRGDLADMLINVRRSVMRSTANKQVPWEHSSLTDRFYFAPGGAGAAAPQAALSYEQQAELAFWNAVKDSQDPAVIKSYVEAYPNGTFAGLAKVIVDQLEREADVGAGHGGKASGTKVASLSPGGPFDGKWRVVRNSPNCRKDQAEFVIVVTGGKIRAKRNFGQVEPNGKIEFRRDDKGGPGFGTFSGHLVGTSGQVEHKGGWNGSSFTCGGQATLTKLDDAATASATADEDADAGPFDGQWRVVRSSPNCPVKSGEFSIVVKGGLIREDGAFGQVDAEGKIEFRREHPQGLGIGVFTGRLSGNAGQADLKAGPHQGQLNCEGVATLTKLDPQSGFAKSGGDPGSLQEDPKRLAELLQKELQRVGCYTGAVDGDWGGGSRSAMSSFNLYTNMALPTDQPDQRAAAIVQKTLTRVCPADARSAASSASAAQPAPTRQTGGSNCRMETLDECRRRLRGTGVGPGSCGPQNRQRVC